MADDRENVYKKVDAIPLVGAITSFERNKKTKPGTVAYVEKNTLLDKGFAIYQGLVSVAVAAGSAFVLAKGIESLLN